VDVQPSPLHISGEGDRANAPTEAKARVPRRMMDGANRSWLAGYSRATEARIGGLCPTVESVVDEVARELRSQFYEPDMRRLASGVVAGLREHAGSCEPR
jgi:hypothetical protein